MHRCTDASCSTYVGQDLAAREHQEQLRQLAEVNAWLAANDKGDKIDVDEVTEPKDPLARQYADPGHTITPDML